MDEPDPNDEEIRRVMYESASDCQALAKTYDVKALIFQPLNQFEAWPEGERADWSKRKAERWIKLCAELGVEMLQVRPFSVTAASKSAHRGSSHAKLRSR